MNQTTGSNLVGALTPEFVAYKKIPRFFREIEITEKIDGTNACICITEDGQLLAGKRSGWITPEKDNFGFAAWAYEHKDELLKMGPGRYFGEWYGKGINRNYGLPYRRFALFHTRGIDSLPTCVSVVPTLYSGNLDFERINGALALLRSTGSIAVPGFLKPEGIVIRHNASGQLFKVTLEGDEKPKGLTNNEL